METVRELLQRHVGRQVTPPAVEAVRRAFTPEMRAVDTKARTITFASSTEDVDRYGDIIRAKGWETRNYMRNPVFLFGHDASQPPIGKCVELHIETSPKPALVQTIEFADAATYAFADTVFKLFKGGFMRAVSVGFKPLARPTPITDKDGNATGGYEFTRQELYELSAVPIPANPMALARAVAEGVVCEADAERVFEDSEAIQIAPPTPDVSLGLARELIAAVARKAGLPAVECDDESAVLRARCMATLGDIMRGLDEVMVRLWAVPPDVLREMLKDWAAMDAEDAARDFFASLTKPEPRTLGDFLESLDGDVTPF